MATGNITASDAGLEIPGAQLQEKLAEVHWYAAYTAANHEKKIARELERRSIECFLPLYQSVRRWKDRRVQLGLPLFPGYVFVHFAVRERLRVLQIPGVVRFVGFGDGATPVPATEISRIRDILEQGFHAEPHPYLTAGRRVRVKSGPLADMEGMVIRRKSKTRFVLSIPMLQRAIALDIDGMELEPLA